VSRPFGGSRKWPYLVRPSLVGVAAGRLGGGGGQMVSTRYRLPAATQATQATQSRWVQLA